MTTPTYEECESVLLRHVIAPWFPRCLDAEHGGFLCDFNRRWRPCGPHDKLLEFQARQTLFAAEACRRYPEHAELRRATAHGFTYLRDALWDPVGGGWFHRLDRSGKPLEYGTKHAHGFAYAIQAAIAVYETSGDPRALELAQQGFDWLDRHAHDEAHQGYFGFLTRDGQVIRQAADCPWPAARDTIGTPFGLKDLNVHSDMLESFSSLYRATGDRQVARRLTELTQILCHRSLAADGRQSFYCLPDWTHVPAAAHAGVAMQSAHRLLGCLDLLPEGLPIIRTAERLMGYALRSFWDHRHGGFCSYADTSVAREPGIPRTVAAEKTWWIQFEGLRALTAMGQHGADRKLYARVLEELWHYIGRAFLDPSVDGVFRMGRDAAVRKRRGVPLPIRRGTHKGDTWKDASHDGRNLLYVMHTRRPYVASVVRPLSKA
ncbi:MAG: AGE family epimerase/isomerase [Verrucomicrobia bacterium]|nr:AGE family epimerase/isomerase [Verrucomicrobiota bacterium]